MAKKPLVQTHRAVLVTGETIDYKGAHPTHWSYGGADADGKPDGSPVRVVPVMMRYPLTATEEGARAAAEADDE